jgi:phosphoglycolate phosphatase
MSLRFELLVFDWDGTVMDSTAHIAQSIQAACGDLGLPVPSDERARHIIGLGLHDAMRYLLPDLPAADYSRMVERYRFHFLAGNQRVTLFDGVREGLARLQARGFLLAVATGKSRQGLERSLADSGLTGQFHATRCADEGFPKPHPEMLQVLMDTFGVRPERTLMIGDTTHDLEMARNAGVSALAAAYGAHDSDKLRSQRPLALACSFGEVMAWLDRNG